MHKCGVFYTDGGERDKFAGLGIHGYVFDTLPLAKLAKAPYLFTVDGYVSKKKEKDLVSSGKMTWSRWELETNLQLDGKTKVVTGDAVTIVDAWRGLGVATNQAAELHAFIQLIDLGLCENYLIFSDSEYLVKSFNERIEKWEAANWLKPDRTPRDNLELWLRILEIKREYGERININWIKAHAGQPGNEEADNNATLGTLASYNGNQELVLLKTSNTDTDYWENEKYLPYPLRTKWCYSLTDVGHDSVTVGGKERFPYMVGDHNEDTDDAELIGNSSSTAGFSFILSDYKMPYIDDVIMHHSKAIWAGVDPMKTTQAVIMVNLQTLMKPRNIWMLKRAKLDSLKLTKRRTELVTGDKDLVSKIMVPALLSLRILDVRSFLEDVLLTYMANHKLAEYEGSLKLIETDITDTFFTEVEGKKVGEVKKAVSSNYKQGDSHLRVMANTLGGEVRPVTLLVNVDIPTRAMVSGMLPEAAKVTLVTWRLSEVAFRYATIFEGKDFIGIWCGHYRNIHVSI